MAVFLFLAMSLLATVPIFMLFFYFLLRKIICPLKLFVSIFFNDEEAILVYLNITM